MWSRISTAVEWGVEDMVKEQLPLSWRRAKGVGVKGAMGTRNRDNGRPLKLDTASLGKKGREVKGTEIIGSRVAVTDCVGQAGLFETTRSSADR